VDAVNSEIASVKESAAVEVERLRRKCEELVEAVIGHFLYSGDVLSNHHGWLKNLQNCIHSSCIEQNF